jgi:predicted choloylglycine hydrolase
MPGLFCELNPGPPPPLADDPAITNKTTPMQDAAVTVNFSSMFNFIHSANSSALDFANANSLALMRPEDYARAIRDVEPFLGKTIQAGWAYLVPLTRQCGQ